MKQRKITLFIVLNLLILVILLLGGCEETPNNNGTSLTTIFIENNDDDGYVAVEENFINGVIISEDNQPMKVGLYSSSDFSTTQENFVSRGIFRFDISEWDNTNITFNIKCTKVYGNPSEINAYFIDDPGSLSDYSDLSDFNLIWALTESPAKFFGAISPYENQWVKIRVPDYFVNNIINDKYSNNEFMTIMLKLYDENLFSSDGYYEIATVDYTPDDDEDQPYIQYEKK